eukprot:8553169-Pyramimonas_sp.AAC.1
MAQSAAPLIHPPFCHHRPLPQGRWQMILVPSAAGDRERRVVPPAVQLVALRCDVHNPGTSRRWKGDRSQSLLGKLQRPLVMNASRFQGSLSVKLT